MPEPIEIMAQEMTLMRQGFTAMQAMLMETKAELSKVQRARSSAEQSSKNEAEGFSVEEMRDPLTNLVEWLNSPKTKTPSARLQEIYNNRENPTMSTSEQERLVTQETKDRIVLRRFIHEGPKYDGDAKKADRFLSKLKQYFKTNDSNTYTDEVLKRCMWNCLGDDAQTRAVNMGDDSSAMLNYTAGEYCAKLVAQFVNVNHQQTAANEYMKRKQTASEDVMFYLHAKQQLYIMAYPPAMRSFPQFKTDMIRGIMNSDLKLNVQRGCLDMTNMSDITERVRQELQILREWNLDPKHPNTSLVGLRDDKLRIGEDQMVKTGQIQMEVNQVREQEPEQEGEQGEVNALKPGTVCYNCGQGNHIAKDCRGPKKETATGTAGKPKTTEDKKKKKVVCYNCNEAGHYSNHCPKEDRRASGSKESSRVSSLEERIERLTGCVEQMMNKSAGFQNGV